MFWVALFGAVSLVLRDVVGTDGTTGAFGSWFADFLCGLLGPIAYALPVFLVVIALRWKRFVRENVLAQKVLLSTIFLVLLSAIVHVFMESRITRGVIDVNGGVLYDAGVNMAGGGFFGGFVGEYIGYVLRAVGTGLLVIPLLLVVGVYLIGLTPGALWQRFAAKAKQASDRRRARDRARYSGEEQRKLHNSRRSREGLVKYEEKKPHGKPVAEEDELPGQYEFRSDDDIEEPTVAKTTVRAAEPLQTEPVKKEQEPIEMVDIPDDEPEEIPMQAGNAVLRRAGGMQDSADMLQDILDDIGREKEAPVQKQEPVVAPVQEERPLQGEYYSPFSLTHRKKLHEDTAPDEVKRPTTEPVVPPVTEPTPAASAEEALGAKREESPVESYTDADGVLVEKHGSTTVYRKEPVRPAAVAAPMDTEPTPHVTGEVPAEPTPAVPTRPAADRLQGVDELLSGMVFADDEDSADSGEEAAVPFARERLTDEVSSPVAADDVSVEEPSALEEDEGEVVTPVGVRREFSLPSEEPERPVAPPTRPMPMRQMRPAQAVPSRVEPVQEEKKPTPPPAIVEYHLPHIKLLKEDVSIKENDHTAEMQEKIEILRETLRSFNIRVKDQVDCSRGPTITRYELRPEAGVSVRSVMNRVDDISLNMAAPVRIEAPIPGKPAIGIEVPNAERETVFMRTVLESEKYKSSTKPLEVPLGLDVGGEIQMCDLAKMPHLLVAGSTGSGKSVCINTILISLMYKTSPRDLRLILIDPKQVEFTSYNHIPHLYAPIVTDSARAVGVLACAVQEMERRYSLIKDVGVRNIEGYNEATKNDPDREHLPYMVIVIDEFADLKMACTNNDVETFTCRLAQKARAAGMHLIIGTQRPTVSVITGNLKNNIPSRIAFKVTQQTDSRTILDSNGAECLLGRGDMLYMTAGLPKPNRVQGAFVSDEEVEAVAEYIRSHNEDVQYNQAFMDQIEAEMARAAAANRRDEDDFGYGDDDDGDEDPKFYEAVELAIETQKVATSLLQRRLGVGYGRAAKIIDRMEALGYVSASDGNKARKVLITAQEYAARMMEGEFDEDEYNE
jgi:S-DNA-T family DNA segregation ATPase FtsK/SpoIIIE